MVKNGKDIEKNFFNSLSLKLKEIKDGYWYLAGMYDNNTVELILTADGTIKNVVFVEDLIAAAPNISGWKFTALKPALDIENVCIEMNNYKFDSSNINFYENELSDYPDEIDITIVYNDFTERNKEQISNGIYIFLDNYLGELDFLNNIDSLTIIGKDDAQKKLIPIEKLKAFLTWRQKEFIEKYEGIRYNTENDTHSVLEAELQSGNSLIAVINTELLNWSNKASHPWISEMILSYDGSNNNGMPNKTDYKLLDDIEKDIMQELKDYDGYLNVGRQTAKGERNIYFACKDFRKPSKVFFKIQQTYSKNFKIGYNIYKDKYWRSFERFRGA